MVDLIRYNTKDFEKIELRNGIDLYLCSEVDFKIADITVRLKAKDDEIRESQDKIDFLCDLHADALISQGNKLCAVNDDLKAKLEASEKRAEFYRYYICCQCCRATFGKTLCDEFQRDGKCENAKALNPTDTTKGDNDEEGNENGIHNNSR